MNKLDFIAALTQTLGQRQEAERAVNKFFESIQESLRKGEKVVLTGIGSLYPKIRKAQKRHNPKTMAPVHVPPKRTLKFVPSEELFKYPRTDIGCENRDEKYGSDFGAKR